MKAPDSLKTIINEMLDKHWKKIINGEDIDDTVVDSSYNICKLKIRVKREATKIVADRYSISLTTKWFN